MENKHEDEGVQPQQTTANHIQENKDFTNNRSGGTYTPPTQERPPPVTGQYQEYRLPEYGEPNTMLTQGRHRGLITMITGQPRTHGYLYGNQYGPGQANPQINAVNLPGGLPGYEEAYGPIAQERQPLITGQPTPGYLYGSQYVPGNSQINAVNPSGGFPNGPSKSYIEFAVFVCICCCWPIGIAAIIYASQVNDANARGDWAAARRSSQIARRLSIASLIFGLISLVISTVIVVTQLELLNPDD